MLKTLKIPGRWIKRHPGECMLTACLLLIASSFYGLARDNAKQPARHNRQAANPQGWFFIYHEKEGGSEAFSKLPNRPSTSHPDQPHSIVAGGLPEMRYTTELTSRTLLVIFWATASKKS